MVNEDLPNLPMTACKSLLAMNESNLNTYQCMNIRNRGLRQSLHGATVIRISVAIRILDWAFVFCKHAGDSLCRMRLYAGPRVVATLPFTLPSE